MDCASGTHYPMSDITELLRCANGGDQGAAHKLFTLLYGDLKRLAHSSLRRSARDGELNTTALVHESFGFPRAGASPSRTALRSSLMLGRLMRSVVLDAVRERRASKRGGGEAAITLNTGVAGEVLDDERLLAVDEAMQALAELDPELHRLVEWRYFAGLSIDEIGTLTANPSAPSGANGRRRAASCES